LRDLSQHNFYVRALHKDWQSASGSSRRALPAAETQLGNSDGRRLKEAAGLLDHPVDEQRKFLYSVPQIQADL